MEKSAETNGTRAAMDRTSRRMAKVRRRLLQAALEMFAEKGMDATTVEEITERADIGKGTFYRHFADKSEVHTELVRKAVGDLLDEVAAREDAPTSLEEALDSLLRAHAAFYLDNRDEFNLLFHGRMLLHLERGDVGQLEEPFAEYLAELEKRVLPFVPTLKDLSRTMRLACAVAGFMPGFISFARVGLTPEELESSMEPVRRAFVAGASAMLDDPEEN